MVLWTYRENRLIVKLKKPYETSLKIHNFEPKCDLSDEDEIIYDLPDNVSEFTLNNTTFKTKKGNRIMVSSCYGGAGLNRQPYKFVNCDYHFIIGDLLYADRHCKNKPRWLPDICDPKETYICSDKADYDRLWKEEVFDIPALADMLTKTGTTIIADDHEVFNNFNSRLVTPVFNEEEWKYIGPTTKQQETQNMYKCEQSIIDDAISSFKENTMDNPLYYKIDYNRYLDIFICDVRIERCKETKYRMMSDEQLIWLVSSINASEKKYKILITSVPLCYKKKIEKKIIEYKSELEKFPHLKDAIFFKKFNPIIDRWEFHTREMALLNPEIVPQRDILIDGIKHVRGLLVVGGDLHYGSIHIIDGIKEVVSSSVGSVTKPIKIKDESFGTVINHYIVLELNRNGIICNYYNSLTGENFHSEQVL